MGLKATNMMAGNLFGGGLPSPEQMLHIMMGSVETRAMVRAALAEHDGRADGAVRLYTDDEVNGFVSREKREAYERGLADAKARE